MDILCFRLDWYIMVDPVSGKIGLSGDLSVFGPSHQCVSSPLSETDHPHCVTIVNIRIFDHTQVKGSQTHHIWRGELNHKNSNFPR